MVLVVLVYFVAFDGGANEAAANQQPGTANKAAPRGQTPEAPGRARPGAEPDEPAPEIPDTAFARADELFDEAKALWATAQGHRQAGETAAYGASLTRAWGKLEQLRDVMSPYSDWLERASLEDWAIPADYDRLQQRFERWDPVRRKVQKLKPAGR